MQNSVCKGGGCFVQLIFVLQVAESIKNACIDSHFFQTIETETLARV
jgi:hypothetical protein